MFVSKINRIRSAEILSVTLFAILANVANAQESSDGVLEEITVTASKMGEANLQDTPIAITAFTGDQLSRSMMSDVRDLEHATPGLSISENTTFAQIYIRGVGSNNVFAGSDPSSTIHIDGIYIARPLASFNSFLDVERVEVLRGPQGTIYGRNSVGGTINVISKTPSFEEIDYAIQAAAGNKGFSQIGAYVSGPIGGDRFAGSIAVQKTDRDPFQENIASGNDQDDDDSLAIKVQLRAALSESADAVLRFDQFEQNSAVYGYGTLLAPSPAPLANSIQGDFRRVAANSPHDFDRDNWGVSLDITAEINDTWSFKSLTGYRENEVFIVIDSDASDLLILTTQLGEDQNQFSQEFNFTGQFDRWNLLLGAYYFQEDIQGTTNANGVNVHPAGISIRPEPEVDTSAYAFFVQASFDLTDRATLTVGARYIDEEKKFVTVNGVWALGTDILLVDTSLPQQTGTYSDVTPKIGIDYKISDDTMLYASATKGFKSGGFVFTAAVPGGFDEEILWAYEAGVKSDLMDGKMRLNATAFYYDYDDLQVQSFSGPGFVTTDNAATAKITGVELEGLANPTPAWRLGASVAWLSAEYDSYPAAALADGTLFDASGNKLNNAPEFSGSLFAEFSHDMASGGSFYVRGEYQFKSEVFFTVDNNDIETQDDYSLINAFAGYTTANGQFSIELFGRNLGDEEYITSSGSFTLVPAGRVGWPVTYGIQLRYGK